MFLRRKLQTSASRPSSAPESQTQAERAHSRRGLPFDHDWDDGVSPRVHCSCDVIASSPVWPSAAWGLRKWLRAEAVVLSLSLLSLWTLVLLNPRAIQFPSARTRPHASSTVPPGAGWNGTRRYALDSKVPNEPHTPTALGGISNQCRKHELELVTDSGWALKPHTGALGSYSASSRSWLHYLGKRSFGSTYKEMTKQTPLWKPTLPKRQLTGHVLHASFLSTSCIAKYESGCGWLDLAMESAKNQTSLSSYERFCDGTRRIYHLQKQIPCGSKDGLSTSVRISMFGICPVTNWV